MFIFNALLFWAVSYLGDKNKIDCMLLALIFAGLHHVLHGYASRLEFFSMPDTRPIPPCPTGTERGANGMDCKSPGDRYGM